MVLLQLVQTRQYAVVDFHCNTLLTQSPPMGVAIFVYLCKCMNVQPVQSFYAASAAIGHFKMAAKAALHAKVRHVQLVSNAVCQQTSTLRDELEGGS